MISPEVWDGRDLEGEWEITYKIDGVRALITDGVAVSRSNKPLYNLEHMPTGDFEIYLGSWEESVSAVRTHDGSYIDHSCAYSLDPLDPRLFKEVLTDPPAGAIRAIMYAAIGEGYEGLVLRQGDRWIKIKPTENADVKIIGLKEGKGRNAGRLGAFITEFGNVGVGLTDDLRTEYWDQDLIGETIEVKFWEYTPAGKFRQPRFIRMRWDK